MFEKLLDSMLMYEADGPEATPAKQPWEMTKEEYVNKLCDESDVDEEQAAQSVSLSDAPEYDSADPIISTIDDVNVRKVSDKKRVYYAESEGEVVGYIDASTGMGNDPTISGNGQISLIVDQNRQGEGIGTELAWQVMSEIPYHKTAGLSSGGKAIFQKVHKRFIQQALSENKPAPREVLEEYKGEPWADEALAALEK